MKKPPKKPKTTRYISLGIDIDLYDEIKRQAKIESRSLAQMVRLRLANQA